MSVVCGGDRLGIFSGLLFLDAGGIPCGDVGSVGDGVDDNRSGIARVRGVYGDCFLCLLYFLYDILSWVLGFGPRGFDMLGRS